MSVTKRLLVFDLDGTLLDSMGDYTRLFCRILAKHHDLDPDLSASVYGELAGLPPERQFAGTLLAAGREPDDGSIAKMTREFWAEAAAWTPPAFPDAAAALRALRRGGHTLVISSGGRTRVAQYRANAAGIDGFFRLILGTDEVQAGMTKGAGHFSLIREALALTGAEFQSRALMVGDGPYDMQVAREAGIIAVGRRAGRNDSLLKDAGADFVIDDLTQLEGLLTGLDRTASP